MRSFYFSNVEFEAMVDICVEIASKINVGLELRLELNVLELDGQRYIDHESGIQIINVVTDPGISYRHCSFNTYINKRDKVLDL